MNNCDNQVDNLELIMHKNITEATKPPKVIDELSDLFYHYTDAAGLLSILKPESPVLWFSRFDCLNDTGEGQDIDEHFKTVCERLLENPKYDKEMISSIMKCKPNDNVVISYDHQEHDLRLPISKIGMFDSEVYMCCFSSLNDLLPMWNYYSNGNAYQGYCIGFDPEMFDSSEHQAYDSTGKKIDGCELLVTKVIYDDEVKKRILLARITTILDYVAHLCLTIEEAKSYITNMLNNLRFVFKKSIFSHENEFRVILYKPKQTEQFDKTKLPQIEYRSRKGIITPYIELRFIDCIPMVESVTIGPLIERDVAEKTIKDFLDNRNYRAEIINSKAPIR